MYGEKYRYLVSRVQRGLPSHHSLAIHVERNGKKIGAFIEAMGDIVIFLYRRYVSARDEGRRVETREERASD